MEGEGKFAVQVWGPSTGNISFSRQVSLCSLQFSSTLLLSCVQLFATPWNVAHKASLSITNSWDLLKLMSIESVMLSNHLLLCHPHLLLPSIFPSIRVFSKESVLHIRGPKYWSFHFSISPSNEYWGLIAFRMDWLDLLVVRGSLKSLLQYHSSKASILQCSDFLFLSSKITADGGYNLEMKRCLLLGRKAMINGESILKNRDHFVNKGLRSFL